MSAPELRRRVLGIFEKGTLEELSTVLALVYVISTPPRSRGAGPDFPHPAGSASKHEQTMFGGE
jgi:hypothetical protein